MRAQADLARDALALMQLQVNTLFVCDTLGRLRWIREPGEADLPVAPRFFMGRTPQGNLWRWRADMPENVTREIERLCRAEDVVQELALATQPPRQAAALRAVFEAQAPPAAQNLVQEYRGPAYWIPPGVVPAKGVVAVTSDNLWLLAEHFPWLMKPGCGYRLGPLAAVVEQGSAVAVCYCARLTEQAAEAGVETAAAFRGRGYASAAVAGWAAAVQQLGRAALYSTSCENTASQGVARRLGMVQYGEDWEVA